MDKIKTIRQLKREKRRKEIEESREKTRKTILNLRRKVCGFGYDSVVHNMSMPKGYVCLYIDEDKKVAFKSNIANVYITIKGAKLIDASISEEMANAKIKEMIDTGDIVDGYTLQHKFYI